MIYSFADFKVELDSCYSRVEEMCRDYCVDCERTDVCIKIDREDIEEEAKRSEERYSDSYLETVATLRKLAEWLPLHNAFVLHSAVFDVEGTGVAFAAHSGTGKTTHMGLWANYLGDRFKVVNGDKPLVRFFDECPDDVYAYGTPWCGKENLSNNMRTKIKHICFIERAEKNSVETVEKEEAVNRMMNQVYMPKNPMAALNTLKLIDRMISSCKLWKIKCNMEPEAAKVAYEAIFGK